MSQSSQSASQMAIDEIRDELLNPSQHSNENEEIEDDSNETSSSQQSTPTKRQTRSSSGSGSRQLKRKASNSINNNEESSTSSSQPETKRRKTTNNNSKVVDSLIKNLREPKSKSLRHSTPDVSSSQDDSSNRKTFNRSSSLTVVERFTPEQILATCLKKAREIAEQPKLDIPAEKKLKYWLIIASNTSQRCDKEEEYFAFLKNFCTEFQSKNQAVVKTVHSAFPILTASPSGGNQDD